MEQDVKKENSRKKTYLRRYLNAKRKQEAIEQEIEELREDEITPGALRQDGMPRGSGYSDLSDYAARLDELLAELNEQRTQAIKLRIGIMHSIEHVPDESAALLLRLRYIQGLTWEKIAEQMRCDPRTVYRLHGRALEAFEMR